MSTKGLEDVVAAQTSISDIDGKLGRLFYVGYDIHDLAPNASFEEVVFLLHNLRLPTQPELDALTKTLAEERETSEWIRNLLPTLAEKSVPMSMLRTTVSAMSAHDPDGPNMEDDANLRKSLRLIARIPTVIASYERLRNGLDVLEPNPDLSLAADFLYRLTGQEPKPDHARIFDMCLVLHADHTMNASTFTARVIASTLADMHSAITGAIASLKGPLHGGANEQVMGMLEDIEGDAKRAPEYIKRRLAVREKIMGFGHRVYKTEDPRATWLRKMSKQLAEETGEGRWFEASKAIEDTVMEEKGLYPNVDFYAASVYRYLGVPTDLFTPIFAASRASGWTAHVREQQRDNRIIRPESEYTGPRNRTWQPIDQRTA
jgi:citrate synthase